ncbi:MAG: OmpA family protein [Elusimicrobiaceae bacterium]|nr:OmpA family protein [Elusimicrobiaceae bacterium]
MHKLKPFLLLFCFAMLVACASEQREEDELTRPKKADPAIEQQQRENAQLARQTATHMGKTLQVPSITYEFDSVRPPEEAYPILDKIAEIMRNNEALHLIIEGHADMLGSEEYNYWLGAARAAAMKSYLVSRGINAERIRIHSYGKDRPITLDTSSEGRRANRRVEFKFTKRNWNAVY